MELIREILFKPAWYWLITILPTVLTYIGIIPENKRSRFMNQFYNLFPFWVWLSIALIAFVVTILISANNYVKKKIKDTESSLRTALNDVNANGGGVIAFGNKGYIATHVQNTEKTPPPNILVGIANQHSVSFEEFTLHLKPLPEKPDMEKILDSERARLLNKRAAETDSGRVKMQFIDNTYPRRVEEHLEKYKAYEIEKYRLEIMEDRWYTLNIVIDSRSMSSASNVVIQMYFPDFIHFPSAEINWLHEEYKESHGKYRPSPPNDPPIFMMPSMLASFPWDNFSSSSLTRLIPYTSPVEIDRSNEYRIIEANNGNIIEYRIKDLLQNHPYTNLEPLEIWLENIEQPIRFNIPVEINARELPEKTKRVIEVNIAIESENEQET